MYEHFLDRKNNGLSSLIAKTYGVYEIQINGIKSISVMVMQNKIIKVNLDSSMSVKFDLKGSMINRRSLPDDIYYYSNKAFHIIKRKEELKD